MHMFFLSSSPGKQIAVTWSLTCGHFVETNSYTSQELTENIYKCQNWGSVKSLDCLVTSKDGSSLPHTHSTPHCVPGRCYEFHADVHVSISLWALLAVWTRGRNSTLFLPRSNPIPHNNWYGAAPWRFKKACSLKGRPEAFQILKLEEIIWPSIPGPLHRIGWLQHWGSICTDAVIFRDPSQQCKTMGFIVYSLSGNLRQLLKLGKFIYLYPDCSGRSLVPW